MALQIGNLQNEWAAKAYPKANTPDESARLSFVGARQGLGVGYLCFVGEGQVNGEPQAYYVQDENGSIVEGQRTLDIFA